VVRLVVLLRRLEDRSGDIEASVDSLRAAIKDDIRVRSRRGAGTHRSNRDAGVATRLERVGHEGIDRLLGPDETHDLRRLNACLEPGARSRDGVERGTVPALLTPHDEHTAAAGAADDEARLDDLGTDQDALALLRVFSKPA